MTTAALLALFAGVLAWPVPRLLASARWPHRCPRAAIVLWQAIGLAGGVSALLATAAFTVAPLSQGIPSALADHAANLRAGDPLIGLGWMNLVGLAAAAALVARLVGVLCMSTAATLRERHRHRHLVDLAGHRHRGHSHGGPHHHGSGAGPPGDRSGTADTGDQAAAGTSGGSASCGSALPGHSASGHSASGDGASGGSASGDEAGTAGWCCLCEHRDRVRARLRILDHPVAVAYCVPGVRHARVVVSQGLLQTLSPDELDAVLAHEEAHVRGRHDLVIQPFVAWERTFPFLRPAREATAAVSLLVEMLADDHAARRTSGRTLARALARLGVARAPVPVGTLGVTGPQPTAVTAVAPPAAGLQVPAGTPVAADLAPTITPEAAAVIGVAGAGRTAAGATAQRGVVRAPVIARISRLLDPPTVPLWLPGASYLGATTIFLTPVILLLT